MDEEMIKVIVDYLSKFYIWEILIILLAILLTAFIKIPIKKRALKLQKELGVDKSIITWVTALFPYLICLLSCFALYWYKAGWGLEVLPALDYSGIVTEGLLLGSGAIGLYEAVKKIIKARAALKEKRALKEQTEDLEELKKKTPFRVVKEEKK